MCPPGRALAGLYDAFFRDWETAFDRPDCGSSNFLRVAVEDVARDPRAAMERVAAFLDLDVADARVLDRMASANRTRPEDAQDARRHRPAVDYGPLPRAARALLADFYERRRNATLPRDLACDRAGIMALPKTASHWVDPPGTPDEDGDTAT